MSYSRKSYEERLWEGHKGNRCRITDRMGITTKVSKGNNIVVELMGQKRQ